MAICGAKKRNGEACQKPPIKGKTKCRLHGGLTKNAGAPTGNKNSAKHNIYSQFMTEEEIEFSQQSELHSVDSELKLCKVQLTRALKAKQAQDDATFFSISSFASLFVSPLAFSKIFIASRVFCS